MIDDDLDEFQSENDQIQEVNDDDLSDLFKLKYDTNRKMRIPRKIDIFNVDKKILETASCVIVKANSLKYRSGNEELALKCIPIQNFNHYIQDLLFQFNHPNVLRPYEVIQFPDEDPRFCCLVMPFIESDLFDYFHWTKNRHLTEIIICQIMKEALEAVTYIHSQGICHADLKLENFLIQPKIHRPKPILIDFELSYPFPNNVTIQTKARGTKIYAAPELLNDDFSFKKQATFDNKIDSWSLGVMLATMIIGDNPFYQGPDKLIKNGILADDPRIAQMSDKCRDLLSKMVCVDAEQRITVEKALEHEWFTIYFQNFLDANPDFMNDEDSPEEEVDEDIHY